MRDLSYIFGCFWNFLKFYFWNFLELSGTFWKFSDPLELARTYKN
jgi:hypothetical protein